MILEAVVSTINADGSVNIAPMGPIVNREQTEFLLRPFRESTTYVNLARHRQGVIHIIDDVLLIARAVTGSLASPPAMVDAAQIEGRVLADCCRWYEFRVIEIDDAKQRVSIRVEVVHQERRRDFFGFNRAMHAVIEAAILASRLHLLPASDIHRQLSALRIPVEKTAGDAELEAFALIEAYVEDFFAGA